MPFTPLKQHLEQVFDATKDWYEMKLREANSQCLKVMLRHYLSQLEICRGLSGKYFDKLNADNQKRKENDTFWPDSVVQLQKVLATHETVKPASDSDSTVIEEWESRKKELDRHIAVSQDTVKAISNLNAGEERRALSNTPPLASLIELSVSLNIKRVDFARLVKSAKTIAFSIPLNIPGVAILTATYDVLSEFFSPIHNLPDADKTLLWLEKRSDFLTDLQRAHLYLIF